MLKRKNESTGLTDQKDLVQPGSDMLLMWAVFYWSSKKAYVDCP